MIVNLRIDRLVLEGLPMGTHEAPLVQAAVEAELARLLGEGALGGMLISHGAAPRTHLAPISGGNGAAALGTQIGAAVYGSIER